MKVWIVHHTSHGEEGEIYGVFSTEKLATTCEMYLDVKGYFGVRTTILELDKMPKIEGGK